jgi:hypothetical protein
MEFDYSVLFGLCRGGKSTTSIMGQLLTAEQFGGSTPRRTLLVNTFCASANSVKEENAIKYENVFEENFNDDSAYNCLNGSLEDGDLVIDATNNGCAVQYLNIHRNDIDKDKANLSQIINLIDLYLEKDDLVIVSLDECDISHNDGGHLVSFCEAIGIDLRGFSTKSAGLKCIEISATMSEVIDRLQRTKRMDLLSYLERDDTFVTFADLQEADRIDRCPVLTQVNNSTGKRELTPKAKELLDSIPDSKVSIIHPKAPKDSHQLISEHITSKGWRVKLVTSNENRNGQDLIKLVDRYDAKKDSRPLVCLVKHAYGRGLEVDRTKLGFVISEIISINESTDYQRHSRQTGYFNINATDFKMFVPSLEKIDRWVAYEGDITQKLTDHNQWYDNILLPSSTHSSSNIRRSLNSYGAKYDCLAPDQTIREYCNENNLTAELASRNHTHNIYRYMIREQIKGGVSAECNSRGRVRPINEPLSENNPSEHHSYHDEWSAILGEPNNPRVQKIMESCGFTTYDEFKTQYSLNKIVQIIEIDVGKTDYTAMGPITPKPKSLNYQGTAQ